MVHLYRSTRRPSDIIVSAKKATLYRSTRASSDDSPGYSRDSPIRRGLSRAVSGYKAATLARGDWGLLHLARLRLTPDFIFYIYSGGGI